LFLYYPGTNSDNKNIQTPTPETIANIVDSDSLVLMITEIMSRKLQCQVTVEKRTISAASAICLWPVKSSTPVLTSGMRLLGCAYWLCRGVQRGGGHPKS